MQFQLLKGFGFAFLLWVLMFAIVSAVVALDLRGSVWTSVAIVIIAGLISYYFAYSLGIANGLGALFAGVLFAGIGMLLDLFISRRFSAEIFTSLSYWVSYSVIFLAPFVDRIVTPGMQHHKEAHI